MASCENCLHKNTCVDYRQYGADCCSDFASKADFLHLKHHIGDHLYEAVADQVTTYRISQVVLREDDVLYCLDVEDGLAAARPSILESEINELCLSYDDAKAQLYKDSIQCKDCIHHKVCINTGGQRCPVKDCRDFVKTSDTLIYPCSPGQEFYVVQPAAHKFNISVPCPITRYVVDRIFVSHYSSCLNEAIALHDGQAHWINVSGFDNFKHLLGRAFFDTREAAEEELRSYIFLTDQED